MASYSYGLSRYGLSRYGLSSYDLNKTKMLRQLGTTVAAYYNKSYIINYLFITTYLITPCINRFIYPY